MRDYEVIKELGSGAFGTVVLVRQGSTKFCVKKVDKALTPSHTEHCCGFHTKHCQTPIRFTASLPYNVTVHVALYEGGRAPDAAQGEGRGRRGGAVTEDVQAPEHRPV